MKCLLQMNAHTGLLWSHSPIAFYFAAISILFPSVALCFYLVWQLCKRGSELDNMINRISALHSLLCFRPYHFQYLLLKCTETVPYAQLCKGRRNTFRSDISIEHCRLQIQYDLGTELFPPSFLINVLCWCIGSYNVHLYACQKQHLSSRHCIVFVSPCWTFCNHASAINLQNGFDAKDQVSF